MIIKDISEKYAEYIIEMRRKFHEFPELGLQENHTCEMILEELKEMGFNPQRVFGTGVMVDIGSNDPNAKAVCLRSDIDGLRVKEETGADYASKREGYMHACGHDAHIAINLGCAKILKEIEPDLKGKVRLIFEPAEEIAKGALGMIAAGALDGIDTVYGTHVWSGLPAGTFSVEAGSRLASADFFTITITGKSTHGSMPHMGKDPILTATSVISNIQLAVHREIPAIDPVVVSFCQIHGGNTDNAIPDQVMIGGTTRAFSTEAREAFEPIMKRVIDETCKAFGLVGELDYRWGSSPVINEERCSARAREAIIKNYGENAIQKFAHAMGGENFSEYQRCVPGVFALLGIRNEKIGAIYTNHSSKFSIDETVLVNGATAAVQYAVDYFEEENK